MMPKIWRRLDSYQFNWSGENAQRRDFRCCSSLDRLNLNISSSKNLISQQFCLDQQNSASFNRIHLPMHNVHRISWEKRERECSIARLSGNIEISASDSIDGFQRYQIRIDFEIKWIREYRRCFQSFHSKQQQLFKRILFRTMSDIIVCKIRRSILQLRQLLKLALTKVIAFGSSLDLKMCNLWSHLIW